MKHVTVQPSLLLANALYSRAQYFGGTTLNLKFDSPESGYLVSIQDGPIFDSISDVNEHELSKWINDNAKLIKTQNLYFGSWKDQSTGKVYFDISKVFTNLNEACDIARAKSQLAIYDITNSKEIKIS